ncbi:TetR/AcrR family transcriptional regulator, partial [Nostoc sp. FACHB-888]|nr:TetR/AcrR family transcriptional regulator [Nostoc sp. FACHB-888]
VELADFFSRRNPQLDATQSRLIATTVVKVSNELLWLSFTREPLERKQLVKETKTLITAYLQTYQI